jgi:hypothetical protein
LNVIDSEIDFYHRHHPVAEKANSIKMARVRHEVDLLVYEAPQEEVWSVELVAKPYALKRPTVVSRIGNVMVISR